MLQLHAGAATATAIDAALCGASPPSFRVELPPLLITALAFYGAFSIAQARPLHLFIIYHTYLLQCLYHNIKTTH
jgi:hypothetical protein